MKLIGDNIGITRITSRHHFEYLYLTESKELIPREKLSFPPQWSLDQLFKINRRLEKYCPINKFEEDE